MKFGSNTIATLKFGSSNINKIYLGGTQIYPTLIPPEEYELTIVVNGLDDTYQVTVDGVAWTDNKKSFPIGTVLENLVVRVEDYDLTPSLVEQVIMDSNKTLEFEGINQGFSHIDIQWEEEYGGYYDADVTRTGNTLTSVGTDYQAAAGFELSGTELASLKFILHEGLIGVLKTTEIVNGQNTFAYGVITEGSLVYAIAWSGGDELDDVHISIPDVTHPILIEIEFTATEVIWYYSEDRIEWARTDRQIFDYYIGAEVYTEIENIKQKGFTATVEPTDDFIRAWSINLGGEYGEPASETGITWNNYKPTGVEVTTSGAAVLNNMPTETNIASTLSVVNLVAFDGSAIEYNDYASSEPLYPIVAVKSGFGLAGIPATLRFSGADITKKYSVSALSVSNSANTGTSITNGAQTDAIVAYNNYPVDGSNRYDNGSLMILTDILPNGSGEFDIVVTKTGDFFATNINLILIREYNI